MCASRCSFTKKKFGGATSWEFRMKMSLGTKHSGANDTNR